MVEAESIIDTRVDSFLHWMDGREVVPTIRALRDTAEETRRLELEHAMRALARGDDPATVLEALSHGISNKLLHAPTQALNQSAGADRAELARTIARLYNLPSSN